MPERLPDSIRNLFIGNMRRGADVPLLVFLRRAHVDPQGLCGPGAGPEKQPEQQHQQQHEQQPEPHK
jgi:hypothetical protein